MATIKEKIESVKSDSAKTNPYTPNLITIQEITAASNGITLVNLGDTSSDGTTTSDFDVIADEWSASLASVVDAVNSIDSTSDLHYTAHWDAEYENWKTIPGMLKAATDIRSGVAYSDATNFGDESEWDLDSSAYTGLDYEVVGTGGFQQSTFDKVAVDTTSIVTDINALAPDGTVVATNPGDVLNFFASVLPDITAIETYLTGKYTTEINTYEAAKLYVVSYGYVVQAESNEEGSNAKAIQEALAGNYP